MGGTFMRFGGAKRHGDRPVLRKPPLHTRFVIVFARMRLAAGLVLIGVLAAQDLPRAIRALDAGKLDEAIASLVELSHRDPDDPDVNYYLGLAYFRAERPRDARPYLEHAASLAPGRPQAWKALGL